MDHESQINRLKGILDSLLNQLDASTLEERRQVYARAKNFLEEKRPSIAQVDESVWSGWLETAISRIEAERGEQVAEVQPVDHRPPSVFDIPELTASPETPDEALDQVHVDEIQIEDIPASTQTDTPVQAPIHGPQTNRSWPWIALASLVLGAGLGAAAVWYLSNGGGGTASVSALDMRMPPQLSAPNGQPVDNIAMRSSAEGNLVVTDTSTKTRQALAWNVDGVNNTQQLALSGSINARDEQSRSPKLYITLTKKGFKAYAVRLSFDLVKGLMTGTVNGKKISENLMRDGQFWTFDVPMNDVPEQSNLRANLYPVWKPTDTGALTVAYLKIESR